VQVLKTKKIEGRRPKRTAAGAGPYNEELFEELRDLRKKLAAEQNVPPYVVFSDKTLHEMARYFPNSEAELLQITGVGATKLARYGPQFIQVIARFREAHPDVRPDAALLLPLPQGEGRGEGSSAHGQGSVAASGAGGRSHESKDVAPKPAPHEATWELLRQGLSLDAIASESGKTVATIYVHLERLLAEGKPIDIDAYVDPATRILIESLFSKHGSERLKTAVENGDGKVTYDNARLRISPRCAE